MKHLRLMAETARDAQHHNALPFLPFLSPFLEHMYSQVTLLAPQLDPAEPQAPIPLEECELYLVACMLFLKNVLEASAYRESKSAVAYSVCQSFFTCERAVALCQLLISRYLVFHVDALQEWEQEPEVFLAEIETSDWEHHAAPCAEALYLELIKYMRGEIARQVIESLESTLQNPSVELSHVLLRDACYRAIGISNNELYDYIPFDRWFQHMVQDMQNPHPS